MISLFLGTDREKARAKMQGAITKAAKGAHKVGAFAASATSAWLFQELRALPHAAALGRGRNGTVDLLAGLDFFNRERGGSHGAEVW